MAKYTYENSFDIDTKELYLSGNEFGYICNIIEGELSDLFQKLENVEKTCWSGDAATAFVKQAIADQKTLMNFNSQLREYGKFLCNTAEEYEAFPTKVGVE